jgi:hypothetical protein
MPNDIQTQRKHERETQAYKAFIVIAKRLKVLEYDNKWEIVPDPLDPLRKFILQRDTPWFKLQVILKAKEFYHRADYTDNRYDYKFHIGFRGFYADRGGDITLISKLEVKPRVVKKLMKLINEKLLPNVYEDILRHEEQYNKAHNREMYFQNNLKKLGINAPTVKSNDSTDISTSLSSNPGLSVIAKDDHVTIQGDIPYDRFAKIAKACGWIK